VKKKRLNVEPIICEKKRLNVEPIATQFRMWIQVCPRNYVLDGVHFGAIWRMWPNRLCAAAMRPYVNLLWLFVIC